MIRALKYPVGLAEIACEERETSAKGYNVNRLLPAVEFYLILKSEAHLIQNYRKQLPYLQWLTKTSYGTFYKQLQECEARGFISKEGKNLRMIGWNKLSQLLLIDLRAGFKFLKYDLHDYGPKLRYLLKTAEISENERKQAYAIAKSLSRHEDSKQAFRRICEFYGLDLKFTRENYEEVKKLAFRFGTESGDYAALQLLNLSYSRNIHTYAKAHGYKHYQGGIYTKRRLEELGLIKIEKPSPVTYKYNQKPEKNITKGSSKFGRYFDPVTKTAFMYRPYNLIVSDSLFTSPEANLQTQKNPDLKAYV